MKMKTVLWLATVLALTPTFSMAQGAHSQFAVAPPGPSVAPTQAPAIAARIPFANLPAGSSPIGIIQAPVIVPNPVFIPSQSFLPNQTVFVPNQVFTPNQVFAPTSVFTPTQPFFPNQPTFSNPASPSLQTPPQVMLPSTQLLVPGQTVIPTTASQSVTAPVQSFFGFPSAPQPNSSFPASGTSRADVLRQLGQPIVSIATSMGETLYFSDGTRVTLQNGQVTGSK